MNLVYETSIFDKYCEGAEDRDGWLSAVLWAVGPTYGII